MIRLVQRKLILPRGDTGSFTIPVLPDFNAGDVAVFAIFNPLNKTIIFRKQVEIADNKITIQFSHNDTVNLPAGKYLWDIKAYLNPEYADGKLVNGDQIDSYYASYKLPECQIKETADDYLMADDAPTSTLSSAQLDLLSAILAELRDAVQKSQENVTHYPTIIDNYWHIWDANTGEYVNTDVKAGGVVVEGTGVGSAKTIDFSYEAGGVQHNATQTASGAGSFSEGINTIASGIGAHAQGDTSEASGTNAHAEGSGTKATNYDTHAEGYYTQATGPLSHAEGSTTVASGNDSHAEGSITVASGNDSHAEGDRTKASGNVSHAEGIFSTASGNYSHAENYQGEASGENSHAEGYISKATKNSAHAEGYRTEAKGNYSHSEGYETIVTGDAAHAEGHQTSASKASAHAEGYHTQATNNNTHAQGYFTVASGLNSHAQGEFTNAVGKDSHAEGYYTYANGINSHSEGYATWVNGDYSHASGYYTIASGNNQYVSGKYNIEDLNNLYAVIVGIGTYNNNRLNGYTLDWSGNGWYAGKVSVTDTTPVLDTDLTSKLYVDTMLALKADIQDIPDISGKADKVSNATSGNFASLDANGNLVDSGHKHSDYLTEHQDISGKQDKLTFDDSPQMISDNPVKSSGLWSAFNSVNSDITFINSQISYLQSQVIGKQDLLYFDTQPKANSNHPVTSGGIKTAIDTAVSTKQDTLTFDSAPTANSTNPVTSGGVYEAITNISTMGIHICTNQEYNSQTGIPTIVSPDAKTFYLVPGGEGNNLYIEWVYVNNAWQQFGSATIDLSGYALLSDIPSNVSAFTNDAGYLTQHQDITGKQDVLTFDNVPTINSTNPVVSNGIYTAINNIIKIQETQPVDPNTKLWIHETNSQTVQVPTVSEVEDMISNAGYLTQHQDISGKADKSDTVLNTTLSRGRKANTTVGEGSFAFGMDTTASGAYSHAQGSNTSAARDYSHAEGSNTKAHGYYSHAEGHGSIASHTCSHAEGAGTIASAICSHAEGQSTTASGDDSHAEGTNTVASGAYSHAEGGSTVASGVVSHAEGGTTTASGDGSHAEGTYTVASGACSHAEGTNTIAAGNIQHVSGKYNIQDLNSKYVEIVGIGTYDNARANGRTLDWNGNAQYAGKVSVGNAIPTEDNDLTSKEYVDSIVPTKLSDLTDDSGHYIKPITGIPANDLESGIIPTIITNSTTQEKTAIRAAIGAENGDDIIKVQDTQPTTEATKIWMPQTMPQGIQVPTVAQVDQKIAAAMQDTNGIITNATGDWLEEHIDTSTGYVIDNTLTVTNAAADAKKTGDEIGDLKSAIADITEETRNLFDPYTIEIGKNGTGSAYANRAISAPIYVGTDAYTVSCDNLPANLKYEIDGYTSTDIASKTSRITSWITSKDTVTTKTPSTYSYIRVLFGSVNDADLTKTDFVGLKLQIEKGNNNTEYVEHLTAVDDVARKGVDDAFVAIDKVDNELLTPRMDFNQGGILSITSYDGYSTNTHSQRVRTIAKLSPPSVTIDPKESGTSYLVAVFDSVGNLLGSDTTWKSDRYYLKSNSIAEIRISIKKVVSGSDVSITPQQILNDGFTVSVDANPIGNFREVTNALNGFTPSKIKVMGYNVGHYAYGTQHGYSGDDADEKIKSWKNFLAKYNVDICGLEEWQRYFDLSSTKDSLALMWSPLYKYHAGLTCSLFSTFDIENISIGYLGSSDPDTQRSYVKGYVTIQGKKVCIMDVHLSPAVQDAVNVRANQINDLLTILGNEKRFIVFGDFNVASTSEYDPFITAGYTLANGGYLGWMNTHNPQDSTKYFDNIIVSPNITVSNFEVLYNEYSNLTSDHYPTIAELTVY